MSYKNDNCKILAPIWNEEFKLPDRSLDHILYPMFQNIYKKIIERRLIFLP